MLFRRTTRPAVVGIAFCLVIAGSILAEDHSALRFRRIQVPVEEVTRFTKGLIPRRLTEFESLVAPKEERAEDFQLASHVITISDEGLAQAATTMDKSAADRIQFLQVGRNLAARNPTWLSSGEPQAAVLGQRNEVSFVVNDPSADTLQFEWDQVGRQEGQVSFFEFKLPQAARHSMQIELPPNHALKVSSGVAFPAEDQDRSTNTWTVHCNSSPTLAVVVLPPTQIEDLYRVRYENRFHILPSGIRLECRLTCSRLVGVPADILRIQVSPNVKVHRVRVENQSVVYRHCDEPGQFDIELPALEGSSFEVVLDAATDCIIGEPFDLPKVSVLEGRWISESVHCHVAGPLQIAHAQLIRSKCIVIESLSDEEVTQFQLESAASKLTFQLERTTQRFNLEGFVNATLNSQNAVIDAELRLTPQSRELFELQFSLGRLNGWVVETLDVELQSAATSNLDYFDRFEEGDAQYLVGLRQPASAENPAILRLRMRNDSFQSDAPISDLFPFILPDLDQSDVWIYLSNIPDIEFAPSGIEHGDWIEPDDTIPIWVADRIVDLSGVTSGELSTAFNDPDNRDLCLRLDDEASLVTVVRQPKTAQLQVETLSHIHFGANETEYEYTFKVDPQGQGVESINIAFSQLVENATWTLNGRQDATTISAIRPATTDPSLLTRLRVQFDAVSEPFQLGLRFKRAAKLPSNGSTGPRLAMPLPAVELAVGPRGTIVVTSEGGIDLTLDPDDGIQSAPHDEQTQIDLLDGLRQLRGVYAYDDKNAALPQLYITPKKLLAPSVMSVWKCAIRSYYTEAGRARHRADFYLENKGNARIDFQFPPSCTLDRLEIDGVEFAPEARVIDSQLSVSLPAERQFVCVSIRYVESDRNLNWVDWLSPPQLSTELEAMETTWQVWLPQDYRVFRSSRRSQDNWTKRVFGEFGSRNGPQLGAAAYHNLRRKVVPTSITTTMINQFESLLGSEWASSSKTQIAPERIDSWGPRLQDIKRAVERARPEFELYIDREELRRLGITPNTELAHTRFSTARRRGRDQLIQAGLALIVNEDHLVVTSAAEIKERVNHLQIMDDVAIENHDVWMSPSRLQRIESWQEGPPAELWRPSHDQLENGLQQGGWNSTRLEFVNTSPSIKVYHRATVSAIASGVFFIGLAVAWSVSLRRQRWSKYLLGGSLVTVLLWPQPGATFALALFWATCMVVVMRNTQPTALRSQSRTWGPPTYFPFWIVCACCLSLDDVQAQDPVADAHVQEEVHHVYFPYGEDNQPSELVYLSPDFYANLLHRHALTSKPIDHLIRSARYTGDWPASRDAAFVTLQVEIQVTTFVDDVKFPLPEHQWSGPNASNVTQIADSVRIDGKLAVPISTDGQSQLVLTRPGDHEVRYRLRVSLIALGVRNRLHLSLPAAPSAELRMTLPSDVRSAVVPTAKSSVETLRGMLSAHLGPSSELQIDVERRDDISEDTSVDQLLLLTIQDDGAELESRIRFGRGRRSLQFKVGQSASPIPSSFPTGHWDPVRRTLRLSAAESEHGVRFRLTHPTVIGQLEIPEVKSIDHDVDQRLLAVVTSQNVLSRTDEAPTVSSVENEFVDAWGTLEARPDLVIPVGDRLPELSVSHAEKPETWVSEMAFLFGRTRTHVEASIRMEPVTPTVVAMRRLLVPLSFVLQSVRASMSDGRDVPLRWKRNGTEVILFFERQTQFSQDNPLDVEIHGTLSPDSTRLPLLRSVRDSVYVSQVISLYRKDDVQLSFPSEVNQSPPTSDVVQRPGYRFAGTWNAELYALDGEAVDLRVEKQVLDRKLTGSMLTRLRHDSDGWSADIEMSVSGSDGEVDAIHLDVPSSLTESSPAAFEGDRELTIQTVRGSAGFGRRIVTVWLPREVVPSKVRAIRMTAKLIQQQPRLPSIRFLNVELEITSQGREHYIELPTRSSSPDEVSRFDWTKRGLIEVSRSKRSSMYERFRVTQDDYAADLMEAKQGIQPEIYLLHTMVKWTSDSNYVAMTQVDLKPGNLRNAILTLPPNATLLQLFCNHGSIHYETRGNNTYGIALKSVPWAQSLRIVYRVNASISFIGNSAVDAPQVAMLEDNRQVNVPILRQLWTLYAPEYFGKCSPTSRFDRTLSRAEFESEITGAFDGLWRGTLAAVRERTRAEKIAWLANAILRFHQSLQQPISIADFPNDERFETIEELFNDFPELLKAADTAAVSVNAVDAWHESQWVSGNVLHCVSGVTSESIERPARLTIRFDSGNSTATGRYVLAALTSFGVIVISRWKLTSGVKAWLRIHPHAAVIAIGFAATWLLVPKIIGATMALAGVVAWAYAAVRQRRVLWSS